jgi:hypothetical protein
VLGSDAPLSLLDSGVSFGVKYLYVPTLAKNEDGGEPQEPKEEPKEAKRSCGSMIEPAQGSSALLGLRALVIPFPWEALLVSSCAERFPAVGLGLPAGVKPSGSARESWPDCIGRSFADGSSLARFARGGASDDRSGTDAERSAPEGVPRVRGYGRRAVLLLRKKDGNL